MSTVPTYSTRPVSLPNDPVLTNTVALESLVAQLVPSPNSTGSRPVVAPSADGPSHPFISAMLAPSNHTPAPTPSHKPLVGPNLTLTANMGITHLSSLSPLVDLFFELEKTVDPARLVDLLEAAWTVSPDQTLKIIFHARSIAKGKGERETFYRCCAWLGARHPRTLFESLPQIVNPLARKAPLEPKEEGKQGEGDERKRKRKAMDEDDGVVAFEEDDDLTIAAEAKDDELTTLSATSHGYYKDLLQILLLSSAGELNPYSSRIDAVLCPPAGARSPSRPHKVSKTSRSKDAPSRKKWPDWTDEEKEAHAAREKKKCEERVASAKELRKATAESTHEAYLQRLADDPFHRALHGAVTSLFATRLRADLALLESNDPLQRGKISLAAKWVGSLGKTHDRHTFIQTSLAYSLIDVSELEKSDDVYRTLKAQDANAAVHHVRYLAHKRFVAPLRAHLDVVERKLSTPADQAGKKENQVRFDRVPSLAMDRYKKLFHKREKDRFVEYLMKVAQGEANISGRALTPATLVQQIRAAGHGKKDADVEVDVVAMTVEGQWKTMVDDVKAGGGIGRAIAVADVSGSMSSPRFKDGTCPMDSSIGLALVLSELATPPFSNLILTFSATPTFVDVSAPDLASRIRQTESAPWGMNTDFVACFRLILDKAKAAKLPPSEMVETVYVLSDMEFDQSQTVYAGWSGDEAKVEKLETHYEEIKAMYEKNGYKLPTLVFWNLAGGKSGLASKPVTAEQEGTVLVSGYSTGMIKAFLEGKVGDEDEDDEDEGEVVGEKGMLVDAKGEEVVAQEEEDGEKKREKEQQEQERKAKLSSLKVLKRAIGDESFAGLKVVD